MGFGRFRVHVQTLNVHLDRVVVITRSSDGLPLCEKGRRLLLVFFGDLTIAFWNFCHNRSYSRALSYPNCRRDCNPDPLNLSTD